MYGIKNLSVSQKLKLGSLSTRVFSVATNQRDLWLQGVTKIFLGIVEEYKSHKKRIPMLIRLHHCHAKGKILIIKKLQSHIKKPFSLSLQNVCPKHHESHQKESMSPGHHRCLTKMKPSSARWQAHHTEKDIFWCSSKGRWTRIVLLNSKVWMKSLLPSFQIEAHTNSTWLD